MVLGEYIQHGMARHGMPRHVTVLGGSFQTRHGTVQHLIGLETILLLLWLASLDLRS